MTEIPAVEVLNLTKNYGELLAVDHINFDIKRGEIFGFLGPNGAGKTTTIRMITGISIPTQGSARVMGYDIQRQPIEAKEQMGIVPEISNVYNELSAWDNLVFTGRLYDMPKGYSESRAGELLKMFGLYERRSEKVEGFSRGMKRRVCIAMALMNKSSILFLDEPTSGLDVESVLTIRELVRELNQEGLTVFLTTHNIEEANQMCDRVAIINRGRIAAIDTPERLKRTLESLQSVEIAFEKGKANLIGDLKLFPTVNGVIKEGDKFRLLTDDPPTALASAWKYAEVNGLRLITVNTVGPSLEDVFVRLTGIRSTAEEEGGKGKISEAREMGKGREH